MIYGDENSGMPDISAIMQSTNLYVYCMNNPVMYKDETGLDLVAVSGSPIYYWQEYNNLPLSYRNSINCYAYAMGWVNNPINGKKFNSVIPPRGAQPGMLVGRSESYYYSGEQIVELVKADAIAAGMVFEKLSYPDQAIPKGTWKIAIVRSTETGDYHFYRQNADGSWSHKQGTSKVKNTDSAGNIIYNPMEAKRGEYDEFIGFYYVGYIL